jgi:murein DD-endopeptidase MepM/ murein hydrolase activator NlpD
MIQWRWLATGFLGLAVLLAGGGCEQAGRARLASPTARPAPLVTATPVWPGNLAKPAVVESPTPAAGQRETPARTATAKPREPLQPCSPLRDHALEELPGIISDGYHPPPMGKDDRHQGVDFSYYRRGERLSIEGVVIQSIYPGRVAATLGSTFPFGNFVIVETLAAELPAELRERFSILEGESLYILYAHMLAAPSPALGEAIEACQEIGQVGKSGNAGVAHLHLEMRHGPSGARFPAMAYYLAEHTAEERANYLLWATSGTFLHFDPMAVLNAQN